MKTAAAIPFLTVLFAAWMLVVQDASAQTNTPSGAGSVPAPTATVRPVPAVPSGTVVNYVRTWEPRQPFTTKAAVTSGTTVQQVSMTTQYSDAIGRPMQTVLWQQSPGGTDMVIPVNYDAAGMEQYKYLPYTSSGTDGSFKTNPFGEQSTFFSSTYLADQPALRNEQFYYSHTDFEASPLNRVSKIFAPGNSWAGSEGSATERGKKQFYYLNNSNDQVRLWLIASNALTYVNNDVSTNIPTTAATYAVKTLYKEVDLDEQGNATVDYTDFDGHVVLHKVQTGAIASDYSGYGGFLCTYNVYDDMGLLRFVIPPKAVAEMVNAASFVLSAGMINELAFRYEYDNLQRPIARKSPGAGWVYTVYDKRDRPVFVQDANMRLNNQWMASLYDALDRPVETGMLTYTGTPSALQAYVTANTGNYTTTAQNVSGTSIDPAIIANLEVNNRLAGQTLYQASNRIVFDPGFTSETGASFVAQIVSSGPLSFTNSELVSDDPIPPGSTFIPLTESNYDNYANTNKNYDNSHNASLDAGSNTYGDPLPANSTVMTRGLATSSKARVIENAADLTQGAWLETVSFYDDKGRAIQVQNTNYKGGVDVTTSLYDFTDRVLCLFEVHNNVAANINLFDIKTNYNYDQAGRLLNIKKNLNNDGNAGSPSTTQRTIASYVYDALGRPKEKKIGQQTVSGSAPSATPLEDQSLAYNIQGWLKGINWNYPSSGPTTSQVNSSTKWFGLDLSYDWGFGTNRFTGSLSGQRWMSGGDGQERSYGFGYDPSGRVMFGDFNQNFGGTWGKTEPANANYTVDYTEKLGDGQTVSMAYDENGNIRQLQHNGLVVNSSPLIDNLAYTYESGDVSNKIRSVADNAAQPAGVALGDFTDKNTTADDYGYDLNGNQVTDLNKRFNGSVGVDQTSGGAVVYSYLNLPYQVTVKNDDGSAKGTITFIYDASGNKLEKRVSELAAPYNNNTAKQTTDSYCNGFLYENNVLQYFGQEEGRVRPLVPATYNNNSSFAYDYFLRDQLGDIRAVLTDELRQDIYPAATVEAVNPASITTTDPVYVEQQFYSMNTSYISGNPPGITAYPDNNGIANNDPNCNVNSSPINQNMNSNYMYRINGGSNQTGLGITLRVMAGDKIDIFGKSYYLTNAPTNPVQNTTVLVSDLLTNLLGGPTGSTIIHGATVSGISQNTIGTVNPLNLFANKAQVGSTPVAYINYVVFSDQFKYLGGGCSAVGSVGTVKDHHADLQAIPIPQNGYIYVYASNTSPVDVYFDNLQVVQTRGPLLQTNNFYPTGLTMAGISGMAAKELETKFKYTGKELQQQEFSDGTGMEQYDMAARFYDPQLGRWNTQDPAGQYRSPYLGMGNNWPNGIDPSGGNFWNIVEDIGAFFALGGIGYVGASLESGGAGHWDVSKWNNKWWQGALTADLIAASFAVGVGEAAAPAGSTSLFGLSATATNIATSAATSIGQQILSTEASSLTNTGKLSWNWDQMYVATLSGAVSGILNSAPVSGSIDKLAWGSHLVNGVEVSKVDPLFKGLIASSAAAVISSGIKETDARGKGLSFGYFFDATNLWPALTSTVASKLTGNALSDFGKATKWYGNSIDLKAGNYILSKFAGAAASQSMKSWFGGTNIFNSIFNGDFFWTQYSLSFYGLSTTPRSKL
ncbi:MAG TPA: DUF6443 domain-containing protein [Puia sp.]|uniref:DUF6443 domain-containing protein n=1 Tax=Puia sp. TaxID=2045100 RepID=UPI002CBCC09D|nr:DUF6443 domain-containing protein [Puia sp.]HVU95382.1 DUF6443 domain-containing protein [Puia sp.]